MFLHSDDAVAKLSPVFIEVGVDILNPVGPDVPGNDLLALKAAFGSEIVLDGYLDNKPVLSGSIPDARQEVRRLFGGMGPGGGYIMAPTNHVQADVPPAHDDRGLRYVQEHGRYPLPSL